MCERERERSIERERERERGAESPTLREYTLKYIHLKAKARTLALTPLHVPNSLDSSIGLTAPGDAREAVTDDDEPPQF